MKNYCFPVPKGMLLIFLILSWFGSFAQNMTKGRVVDSQGSPLLGVNIVIKGTTTGTLTNVDGNFSISVRKGQTLLFSFIGFMPQEKQVNNADEIIKIVLEENIVNLDEVVAIGYGSVKKKDLTGSVTSIKNEELTKINPTGVNQALQGKIAGVQVSQADGAPGAGINIQIRGANSFTTSTEPLYVVDGIPFGAGDAPGTDYGTKQTTNPLNLLNPQDIEYVEVLKDASATAIYGSRGANGVILITTKRGKEGTAKVEFSANFGISQVIKQIDVLDAATYAEYRNEQVRNGYTYDGKEYVSEQNLPYPGRWSYTTIPDPVTGNPVVSDSTYLPSPDDYRNGYMNNGTDWQDQIFHTAVSQNYNIGVTGGDSKGQYAFSLGMLDQQGVIYNSYFKRYSSRLNISRKINPWFELGNNLTVSKSENRMARTNTETYGVIPSAISFNPTLAVFDPDEPSGVTEDSSNGLSNPYLYVRTAKNLVGGLNIYNSSFAQITFTDFLSFRQNLGYGYNTNTRNQYYNRYVAAGVPPANGYGVQADNYYESMTTESMLFFKKDFATIHHVDAVVATTFEQVDWGGKTMSAKGFPNDLTEENDMGSALIQEKNSTSKGKSSIMSFLGRVNYIYKDRYLATFSMRRDGSSRFSKTNRWGNFLSGALAWRLSEEEFVKQLNFFDNLKLRLSVGQTGNQGINAYATRSRMTSQQYPYDGSLTAGFAEDRWGGPAAPNLKWETTTQYNIGLDASVLKNRINLVVDWYYKDTKDLLQYMYIPPSTGFSSIATNYGNIVNKGLEISGNFLVFKNRNFDWKLDANISFNRNKISNLEADQFSDVVWGMESVFLRRNGQPLGVIYAYEEDGYFDNEAEVRANPLYKNATDAEIRSAIGQVKYKDRTGDGAIDDRDKTIVGDTNPDFTYGITNTFTYKKLSLNFFLQGTQGNDILNVNIKPYDLTGSINMPRFIWDNRWTEANREHAEAPRSDNTFTRSLKASDRYVEDGSYLRLKNLNLGYRFDRPIREIESLNLSVGVNNLFTITKYRWYDPDVNTFGSDPTRRGVDMASYPSARTYNVNIQVVF